MCDCILIFFYYYVLSNSTVINIRIAIQSHKGDQSIRNPRDETNNFFLSFYPPVLGITSFTSQHHLQRILPGPKVYTDLNICIDTL